MKAKTCFGNIGPSEADFAAHAPRWGAPPRSGRVRAGVAQDFRFRLPTAGKSTILHFGAHVRLTT